MQSGSLHVRHLEKIILPTHVQERIDERGGDEAAVRARVRLAHDFVSKRAFLLGLPLALTAGPVVPVVEFRQRGSRAVVATVLLPGQALKPGTVPVEV